MTPNEALLSIAELHELLVLERSTGELRWKKNRRGGAKAGTRPGRMDAYGYHRVKLKGHEYMAHRVVWALEHGEWPQDQIDHRDRKRARNAPNNLRPATGSMQHRNAVRMNNLGLRGVYPSNSKRRPYQSSIRLNGKTKSLGTFTHREDAARAYDTAVITNFGEGVFPTNQSLGLL